MRPSLAIRTLFRTMGKTLFTFLLITVLTFSLFIQLAEYLKTAEEFAATVDSYIGTGYVQYRPPTYTNWAINLPYYLQMDPRVDAVDYPEWEQYQYPSLSAETVDEISNLPHISAVSKRYMTAGVSGDYRRMKEDVTRYDYNARLILEGTMDQIGVMRQLGYGEAYKLRDVKVLAGDTSLKELLNEDGSVYFGAGGYVPKEAPGISYQEVKRFIQPECWRVRTVYLNNYPYKDGLRFRVKEGERYVVVCRFERQAANRVYYGEPMNVTKESLELYDWASEHACASLWSITDAPENYLELPEYAPLRKLIDVTQADLNTFDVVYADDMSAIKRVDDNTMQVREGRWLTRSDTETNAKVCVIDGTLAQKYDLKLADKLSLNLGHTTFEQFYSLGAIASVPERFSDEWTQDEFEIVGIYGGATFAKDANEPNWAYSANTVFVPLSSLPLTETELEGHAFYPGELTIRVEDAWEIEPFLKKTAPQIEAMGLTLNFDDGGWMQVLEGYRDAQRIPLIRILLLAFVTVTGIALSVYLFVSRKRKDYAIMRALGTPKDKSARALLIPIGVLSLAAVLFAVVAGLVYSKLLIGTVFLLPVAICIGGELAFTLLFAGLSLWRLSRLPPLLLLQGSGSRTKKSGKKKTAEAVEGTLYMPTSVKLTLEPLSTPKSPASVRFVLCYVWRHIRRQGLKSALAILLAALMVGAVTQLASLRDAYNSLRESTVVPVQFVNSLSLTRLQPLIGEGLTKELYYERTANISFLAGAEGSRIQIVTTSNVGRFLNEEYVLSLGADYTENDIGKMNYALIGSELMEEYALQPGDYIRLGVSYEFDRVFSAYNQKFLDEEFYSKGLKPGIDDFPERQVIYKRYKEDIERDLDQKTAKAEIIGSIQVASGRYTDAVFTAGLDDSKSLVGTFQTMPLIEFVLSDNTRLEEMQQKGEELTKGRSGAFVMEPEKLESVIRTSNLLNGLFPAVMALALLIGAALCALLVMQNTRDAAIMRALGTTKRKTRSMLAVEQILLGVMGIIVGICVMLAIKKEAFAAIAVQAALFAAAYALVLILGAYASAALATRKNILELLQTKE